MAGSHVNPVTNQEDLMSELLVDYVTTLDGYGGAGEGWSGWWGLQGPEYLGWLREQPEYDRTALMGATTYRLHHDFQTTADTSPSAFTADERASIDRLAAAPKVVFSSTLETPLPWQNSRLVRGDAVEEVARLKRDGTAMRTVGSLTLVRSLLEAGVVDRFRVTVFPVITGRSGLDRIYDLYPDVMLDMVDSRVFDGGIQLLEYAPTVLAGPPRTPPAP